MVWDYRMEGAVESTEVHNATAVLALTFQCQLKESFVRKTFKHIVYFVIILYQQGVLNFNMF